MGVMDFGFSRDSRQKAEEFVYAHAPLSIQRVPPQQTKLFTNRSRDRKFSAFLFFFFPKHAQMALLIVSLFSQAEDVIIFLNPRDRDLARY